MKNLTLIIFIAISTMGFGQKNIDCGNHNIKGYWIGTEPNSTDSLFTLEKMDTSKGVINEATCWIEINRDSTFQIVRGVMSCGTVQSKFLPLGYWRLSNGCKFNFYKANTIVANSSYNLIESIESKLTLQRIK